MKFGFRKPSLKRSISAMTTGALKRALLREIIPGYSKRGMGWANPKKAAYNHLYSMVTSSPVDLILDTSKPKCSTKSQLITSESECQHKQDLINIYKIGIEQSRVAGELINDAKEILYRETPLDKAIRRIFNYSCGYLNNSMSCGFDFCDMCVERLNKIQRINPIVKEICLEIVSLIRQGNNSKYIYNYLNGKFNV